MMNKYDDLTKILPHRVPMILLSRIIDFDLVARTLTAEVEINPNTMFFNKDINGVPSWFGLEYMAQSVAALSGIYEYEKSGGEPKMGFILGTRRYENKIKYFEISKIYNIKVSELFNQGGLCCFECTIFNEKDNQCAYAELNLFEPK